MQPPTFVIDGSQIEIVEKVQYLGVQPGVAPGISRRGVDSSDEGTKIWCLRYYKCQKSQKKSPFTFRRGASMLRRGAIALPWRHPLVQFDQHLVWDERVRFVCAKVSRDIGLLKYAKKLLPQETLSLWCSAKFLTRGSSKQNFSHSSLLH